MKLILIAACAIALTACSTTESTTPSTSTATSTTVAFTQSPTTLPRTSVVAPIKIDLPDLKGKTVKQGFDIAQASGYKSWQIKFENQTLVEKATGIQDWVIESFRVVEDQVFFSPTDAYSYSQSQIPPSVLTYKVYGAKSGSITYNWVSGSTQETGAKLPWSKETTEDIDFMYVSVQNNGGGSVACEILRDGNSIAKNIAKGSYAIATCQV